MLRRPENHASSDPEAALRVLEYAVTKDADAGEPYSLLLLAECMLAGKHLPAVAAHPLRAFEDKRAAR